MFLRDLAGRGIPHAEPSDPLDDIAWKQTLMSAYPSGYSNPSAN